MQVYQFTVEIPDDIDDHTEAVMESLSDWADGEAEDGKYGPCIDAMLMFLVAINEARTERVQ